MGISLMRNYLTVLVSATSLLACASSSSSNSFSEWELFKYYSLSSCIATHYEESNIYQDAVDALNGYREFGSLPLQAYHEVSAVINSYSPEQYRSKAGNISELAMCVAIQNSKDIKDIYAKYAR